MGGHGDHRHHLQRLGLRALAPDPENRTLLENYFLPGDLEAHIRAFIDHYNHRRDHESLGNLTPADVYFRRGPAILDRRAKIKKRTIETHRLNHHRNAA